jgi:hypothetical protein
MSDGETQWQPSGSNLEDCCILFLFIVGNLWAMYLYQAR